MCDLIQSVKDNSLTGHDLWRNNQGNSRHLGGVRKGENPGPSQEPGETPFQHWTPIQHFIFTVILPLFHVPCQFNKPALLCSPYPLCFKMSFLYFVCVWVRIHMPLHMCRSQRTTCRIVGGISLLLYTDFGLDHSSCNVAANTHWAILLPISLHPFPT